MKFELDEYNRNITEKQLIEDLALADIEQNALLNLPSDIPFSNMVVEKFLDRDELNNTVEEGENTREFYEVIDVARETVRIIDLLSDKNSIFINVTAGRKTKALGLLFGAYARSDRIKRIIYVREENKQIMNLPKLSYITTLGQLKIVEYLLKNDVKSRNEFSEKIDVSRAMLYKHIRELKDMDIIEEIKEGLRLTDNGKIVVL